MASLPESTLSSLSKLAALLDQCKESLHLLELTEIRGPVTQYMPGYKLILGQSRLILWEVDGRLQLRWEPAIFQDTNTSPLSTSYPQSQLETPLYSNKPNSESLLFPSIDPQSLSESSPNSSRKQSGAEGFLPIQDEWQTGWGYLE